MATKPTLRHRRLARAMTELREKAGLSGTDAALAARINKGTVSRLEAAEVKPSGDTVHALCVDAYGADERTTNALVKLAREVKRGEVGWWQQYSSELVGPLSDLLELESDAIAQYEFCIDVVPGLLQTKEYARACIAAGFPGEPKDVIDQRVEVRMSRQKPLLENALRLWVVIDETALSKNLGSPQMLAEQLDYLAEVAELPSVSLQILPSDTPEHPAIGVPFRLLSLDDEIEYAYVDNLSGGAAIDDDTQVRLYRAAWTRLAALGLSFSRSAVRIKELAAHARSRSGSH